MEIRSSTTGVLLQASPSAPTGPVESIAGSQGRQSRARGCGQSFGRSGQRTHEVEPRHPHEPAEAEVHEETRKKAACGFTRGGHREQPAPEEFQAKHSPPENKKPARCTEKGPSSRAVGSGMPEGGAAGDSRGSH